MEKALWRHKGGVMEGVPEGGIFGNKCKGHFRPREDGESKFWDRGEYIWGVEMGLNSRDA